MTENGGSVASASGVADEGGPMTEHNDGCPPHDWQLRCPTCGAEESVTEQGAADALCWLFTALGHGGSVDDPRTWTMHVTTAGRSVALLAERGVRLVGSRECGCAE